MKSFFIMIVLCVLAITFKAAISNYLPNIVSTLTINFVGCLLYLILFENFQLSCQLKNLVTISFFGTLTTYSGIFSDLYYLIDNQHFFLLVLYLISTFIIIPLVTYQIIKTNLFKIRGDN